MKLRYALTIAVIAAVLVAGGMAAIAAGGDDPADINETGFVGMSADDAIALAEQENRPWRIARQDGETFALTDDLNPGRVTFEIDDGVVTNATIEVPSIPSPDDGAIQGDAARADLIAAALHRLLTVDNSFGGESVFDDIRVGTSNLDALDVDTVTAALAALGSVSFVDDPKAEIEALFDGTPAGIAVAIVERVLLLDDRAEVELQLWCGSLCGVFLTYEAVAVDAGWEIVGTAGPIAVS